jgi:hypothetical protein
MLAWEEDRRMRVRHARIEGIQTHRAVQIGGDKAMQGWARHSCKKKGRKEGGEKMKNGKTKVAKIGADGQFLPSESMTKIYLGFRDFANPFLGL